MKTKVILILISQAIYNTVLTVLYILDHGAFHNFYPPHIPAGIFSEKIYPPDAWKR